jgi:uncharacterized protein with von Willebrand factor type A (vWA) domain
MSIYHPISLKIGTQTNESMLSLKNAKAEVTYRFQNGRRRLVGISSACYEMGNYHPISMKIGTRTKKNMLTSKVTTAEAYGKKQKKLNLRSIIVLRRQRCMSAKL